MVSVPEVAAAPAVPCCRSSFNTLWLLYPLILRFVCSDSFYIRSSFSACCGSGCSFLPYSAFFRMLQLLLLVILLVFPHAADSSAASSLFPRFALAASPAASGLLLWLLFFLVAGSPEAVPPGSLLHFPTFLLFPIAQTFTGFLCFSSLCSSGSWLSIYVSSSLYFVLRFSSLRLRFILSWYTLLSLECCSYFLWCFCLVRISGSLCDVVSLWDESGFVEASLSLSSQSCIPWWCPFLYQSPFCSYASFASTVPFATWSPFGLVLLTLLLLSCSGVWFFPVAVTFPPRSRGIHPSSVSSLVAFPGCGLRSLRCIRIYGCFVSTRLLSSERRSLFLSWPFFLFATPSSVSGCLSVLFLGSVTRSDLRLPLATGSPVGTGPLCFSYPFVFSSGCFVSFFVGCSLGFILFCILSSFSFFVFCLCSFPSLFVGVVPSAFLRFSFRSAFLDSLFLFSILSFALLQSPPWGSSRFPLLVLGFSLPGLSP